MPVIFLKTRDGERVRVEAPLGASVMRAALAASVEGIIGECGGCATCLTCHCYVAPSWLPRLNPPTDHEKVMLESVLEGRPNSRLTCQITVTSALDGLELTVPAEQG